ncbi:immune inhibitor A [Solirubrobacter ginsenosidimutans]|uniref:Immune inhibitor A n=1 Tax=Solirubrobacter ginsenosidimutans TaxID=490573 RepID=A0A9X3MRS4_9ACTN|nr:immune inhibitor A domain-containing protein [Solirubrobacter ginsenosidimutans]MDA0161434.1 immune inhibitor A [Solirubrobacter ginsenosidimutans]
MFRVGAGLGSLGVALGLATTFALTANAAPPEGATAQPQAPVVDDLPNPAETKRRELREAAIKQVLAGRAKVQDITGSKVVKLGKTAPSAAAPAEDQYVELAREKTDKIFVVLAEFGNERAPGYPDQDTDPKTPGPATFNGPLHNAIPAPDRTKDNSTVWQPDYNRDHYQQLYFGTDPEAESVKTYYERQSSGRYTVDGQVTDWVKVRYNEARYGRSNGYPCAGNVCSDTWDLIKDAIDTWVADQHAKGRTDDQIKADLASYDQWDRNDYDHDGNFNEPDGYIDHFQIVHAGGDQADGDPQQGEDAIWSHRWKAFQNTGQGPAGNKDGGTQIGATGLWVADYTIQPENGGISVFAHEYGHDLGLPDEYDTAAAVDTAVNWWTLMSQSRTSAATDQGIGTRAADLGAWDKLQLGWLDYEIVVAGQNKTLDLGPHEGNTAKAQGLVMVLPKKTVTTPLGAPAAGANQWYSGTGDDYEASLARQVAVPSGTTTLSLQARWNIEDCGPDACDYAWVEVDDGTGYKAIAGSITKPAEGNGIDGVSGGYKPATFDLSAYANKTVSLRFHYKTDGAQQGNPGAADPPGIFLDEIKLTNGTQTLFTDGAENGANGWTASGFSIVGAVKSTQYDHYYIASNRTYTAYDRYLQTGPYNFGFPDRPDWVEHFPYQNGLLVSYWDTSFSDNNESVHPGQGEILPIDANPSVVYRLDGKPWRGRVQTYDAPFGLEKSDSFTLHAQETGAASYIRGQAAQPVFDDRREFWDPALPFVGVKVPHVGVTIRVTQQSGTSMRVRVAGTTGT